MSHFGLAIDPETDDLFLADDDNLATATEAEAVAQHARQRLTTFEGEWLLDNTAGVPWLDEIMAQSYDPALAEAVVKAELIETDGVTEITEFSVAFDRAIRRLRIRRVRVQTIYNQEVTI